MHSLNIIHIHLTFLRDACHCHTNELKDAIQVKTYTATADWFVMADRCNKPDNRINGVPVLPWEAMHECMLT